MASSPIANVMDLCPECRQIIFRLFKIHMEVTDDVYDPLCRCCSLCINMLCCVDFQKCLTQHVLDSLGPYGGINNNQLSKTWPTITVPSILYIQAQAVIGALQGLFPERHFSITSVDLVIAVKDRLRQWIYTEISRLQNQSAMNTMQQSTTDLQDEEEAGYISWHILLLIPVHILESVNFCLPIKNQLQLLLQEASKKSNRRSRRKHPMDISVKQGGDPRMNLERRILSNPENEYKYFPICDKNQMIEFLSRHSQDSYHMNMNLNHDCSVCCCSKIVHSFTCAWRKPFYIQGQYTKSRRDVSQSPFYVRVSSDKDDANNRRTADEELKDIDPFIPEYMQGTRNYISRGGDLSYSCKYWMWWYFYP